jgi:hypothetical protein
VSSRPQAAPVNLSSNAEVQAWIAKLEAESKSVGRRNIVLWGAFAAGMLLLLVVCWGVYRSAVRSYAVVEGIEVTQNDASHGRLQIAFRVLSPGKVFYRRTSGSITTEVVDYFDEPGEVRRNWSWVYEPGKDIHVEVCGRSGLWRQRVVKEFPTAKQADIVVLMDTTGSMSRYINMLKEKCVGFSDQLKQQSLEHRFALIGFGDVGDGPKEEDWLDKHEFTDSASQFQEQVAKVRRFDGGDLPESALDALDEALRLRLADKSIRRFYLVTDAQYHDHTRNGRTVEEIAAALKQQNVVLNVFSREEFEGDYRKLLGDAGKFQKLEDFGKVLTEGRILED